MALLDDVLHTARDVVDIAAEKTVDFVSMTKLRIALADVKREIALTMEGLGRLVYDAQKSDADIADLVAQACKRVDQLTVRQRKLERQLCAYRKATICGACDAINDEDAYFCKGCGSALPK